MVIPEGVDHVQFYWQAKKKDVQITSRYPNVYIALARNSKSKGNPKWVGIYSSHGQVNHFRKSFPFSELGEKSAHAAVERYIEENNITERRGRRPHKNKKYEKGILYSNILLSPTGRIDGLSTDSFSQKNGRGGEVSQGNV